jgi:hypothetical protein
MYTHTGMKGLAARESLDSDPILTRHRKWHACNHVAGDAYKALCGVTLEAVSPEESAWGSRVDEKDTHRITCKRCKKRLADATEGHTSACA